MREAAKALSMLIEHSDTCRTVQHVEYIAHIYFDDVAMDTIFVKYLTSSIR